MNRLTYRNANRFPGPNPDLSSKSLWKMSKQSYCQGKLSMSSMKQVVIWAALGAWIHPFLKTPSRREHWRYTFTKSFKQASKHLWGQGAPTDLAFPTDMLAKYAVYLTPSVGSQLVQGKCEAHTLMHPLNLHRTFSWLCLMTVHSYRHLKQLWVSTKICHCLCNTLSTYIDNYSCFVSTLVELQVQKESWGNFREY